MLYFQTDMPVCTCSDVDSVAGLKIESDAVESGFCYMVILRRGITTTGPLVQFRFKIQESGTFGKWV